MKWLNRCMCAAGTFMGVFLMLALILSMISGGKKEEKPRAPLAQQSWRKHPEALLSYLASQKYHAAQKQKSGHTRGILIPAGGRKQLAEAYLLLRMLRDVLNSTLPVELVYNGEKEAHLDLFKLLQRDFSSVALIDGSKVQLPAHQNASTEGEEMRHKGWSFKVFALCYVTSFSEVLLLDSDNLPLVRPEALFELGEFRQHGGLFWPDFMRGGEGARFKPEAAAYQLYGLPVPWMERGSEGFRLAESGQVLLDRARHADVLEWLWHLNSDKLLVEELMLGDKDTFRMAFQLAGKGGQYAQVQYLPREALGKPNGGKNPVQDKYHHRGMVQYLPDGRMGFHHRTAGSKVWHSCCIDDGDLEGFRVQYITLPPTPAQSKQAANRGWVWAEWNVDTGAWIKYECGDSSQPDAAQHAQHDGGGPGRVSVEAGASQTQVVSGVQVGNASDLPLKWADEGIGRQSQRQLKGPWSWFGKGGSQVGDAKGPMDGFPELRCRHQVGSAEPLPAFPMEAYGVGGRMIEKGFELFKQLRTVLPAT